MKPISELSDLMRVLYRTRVAATTRLTGHARTNLSMRSMTDHVTNELVLRLETEVLREHVDGETIEFVEGPTWESWKHRLVDELPLFSFRRRFLGYLWDIDPDASHAKIVRHEVVVERWMMYPDAPPMPSDAYGRPVRVQEIRHVPGY